MTERNSKLLTDVDVSFVSAVSVEEDAASDWRESVAASDGVYEWSFERDGWRFDGDTDDYPDPLREYLPAEQMFFNKVFTLDRELVTLLRTVNDTDLKFNWSNLDSVSPKTTEAKIVSALYQPGKILVTTIVLEFDEISIDDLIYLKSLKRDSSTRYDDPAKINYRLDGSEYETTFRDVFSILRRQDGINRSDVTNPLRQEPLDVISLNCSEDEAEIYEEARIDVLYGLLTGDEGYSINDLEVMTRFFRDANRTMRSRDYFRYYFFNSSILALFAPSYPERKLSFAESYYERYGRYEPYDGYLDLDADPDALSDGVLFLGELILVRHLLLLDIDRKLQSIVSHRDGTTDPQKLSVFNWRGPRLRRLIELRMTVRNQLMDLEMLSQNMLWNAVLARIDSMYNYDRTKDQIEDRVEQLENSIRDSYDLRTQTILILLTLGTIFVTIITLFPI